ncbi:MAG: DNA polymerase IV [Robiginitomaculum sp.]|nr:MAG: DNA polymerase IV [Robiginitomaculum sp.]
MSKHDNICTGLCRDCGADVAPDVPTCPKCRSYRLLYHPELHTLSIAHVDCDAFFASVEKRDNPELADKPVIIGGGTRGVVAAACYNARVYGVRSAMPMFKALKACPHAVVIRPTHNKYSYEGGRVKKIMLDYTPLVQPISIDEAFLDLTGTERLHGGSPASTLIKLQNRIHEEIGVTVSVGLSYNKFLAKTASDLDKPNGFALIGQSEALDFLKDKPVEFIFGIGPAFARTLNKAGIKSIADVRKRSDSQMMKQFGESGLRLAKLSRAEDHRPVKVESIRKSISTEITFNTDIGDETELTDRLWQVCEKTADRAKAKNMAGYVVTLKLKTHNFQTITRRRTLTEPVQLADIIFHTCLPLLQAEISGAKQGRKFRLIGAGLSSLCPPAGDAGDLLDPKAQKRRIAERASDKARQKFGTDAVMTGRALRRKGTPKPKNKTS